MKYDKLVADIDIANRKLVETILKDINEFLVNKGFSLTYTHYNQVEYTRLSDGCVVSCIYNYNNKYMNPNVIWFEVNGVGVNWSYKTETLEGIFEKKKVKKFNV